ncbi:MAG: anti-anti-sigma factor [Gammaproteobacteria bacterium RIFCSPLOWO2_02_FULL_61_13]|nr:MAG: anti-anti-sigma factor [Gammaproteobacteria bacterium RIFCSPLOWO2_02_FULL_61_13]
MQYNSRNAGTYAVLDLKGDVDLSCSPDARKQILQCLEAGRHLLIDLSAVSYIDSSGVASLVEGYQTAKKKNLRFGLVGVSSAAMGVLQLARLDKVFPIHASVEERMSADG